MAWVNNNKKNARFNPNRKDDRLLGSEVTSRREHKKRKETEPEVELVSTAVEHVLGMQPETRVDWLQMALMQAAVGKLKAASLYDVVANPAFVPGDAGARRMLRALMLANLHLFSSKQKRTLEEVVKAWGSQYVPEAGNGSAHRRTATGPPPPRDASRGIVSSSSGDSSSSSGSGRGGTCKRSRSRERHRRQGQRHKKSPKKQKQEPLRSRSRRRRKES
mmetsp:Transcript_27106/g.78097  ORF Transcript_27106/g.78097 Transcript_27106/m.78097 type:complete len:219 (+) Transcript_27106:114-770(+)